MTDIQEFLADFEQVPEARNLYGVRAVMEELQSELDKAREDNYSGCVHTIGTAVDREGCCTSCGEDLNYLAMMQIKLDSVNHDYAELMKERADYVAENNKRLRKVLVDDTAFPLLSCLDTLADAADHLLDIHNCDVHGYELIGSASKAARKHIIKITQALKKVEP